MTFVRFASLAVVSSFSVAVGLSTAVSGCASSSSGSSGGGSSSSSSSSSSSGSSKPSGATNVKCSVADDCGYWFCDCKQANGDVTPVNGRSCNNGFCMDAATACPDACTAFGYTWAGTAGGGPDVK